MTEKPDKGEILYSWKEIADYLKFNVKTCQKYEKEKHLPIRRYGTGKRSPVFAYKNEIAEWRRQNGSANPEQDLKPLVKTTKQERRKASRFLVPIFLVPIVFIAFIALTRPSHNSSPVDFHIRASILSIIDKNGKMIWEHDTQLIDLEDEEFYRQGFPAKKIKEGQSHLSMIQIKDINVDKHQEILFAPYSTSNLGIGNMICFDDQHSQLWEKKPGGALNIGNKMFSADFAPGGFDSIDLDGDKKLEVIFTAHAFQDYPTFIAAFDCNGLDLGTYWNMGQVVDFAYIDLNRDNRKEILVAGMNQEYSCPVLVILELEHIAGSSPQTKAFSSPHLDPGQEKYYLRFGLSTLDELFYRPGSGLACINVLSDKIIQIQTFPYLVTYRFDMNLNLLDIKLNDSFRREWAKFKAANLLHANLDDQKEIQRLKNSLLYFDGRSWSKTPAMSNHW